MKKYFRLKTNRDFSNVINKKICRVRDEYIVYYLKNNLGYSRVGISTSKKLGNAVLRNRIRRQIRAIIDSIYDYKNGKYDIVIIVRKKFVNNAYKENLSILNEMVLEINKDEEKN